MRFSLEISRIVAQFASTLLILFIFVVPVKADPLQDPPPETSEEKSANSKHIAMLRNNLYAELDIEMNGIQRAYENGEKDDVNLSHLFRAFFDTDPALEAKYEAWIQEFPNSYAAREAQGIYFRKVGFESRGDKYAKDTKQGQFNNMQRYLERAMESHQTAMSLTAKPMLTYYNIMSIAKLAGSLPLAKRMLETSKRADPKNFIVRYKYMLMLETRWGGSLEQMKQFRAESKSAGLPDHQLRHLDDLISDEVKWLARSRQ
jgi:hypothetical protein